MIEYRLNHPLETHEIIRVFESSEIVRPTNDHDRIARMFAASNCVISAWSGRELVGICRALSDHCYSCYLSDLACRRAFKITQLCALNDYSGTLAA